MGPIFALIIVLFVAFFLIRTGTAALTLLGLSRDLALFQAISAFTGVGFTTSESEHILNHPDRRRVVMSLMVIGNVGLMTAVSSLVLTFANTGDTSEGLLKLVVLIVVLGSVLAVLLNRRVSVPMHHMLRKLLRRTTRLKVVDFVDLLQLTGEYGVVELPVDDGHWLTGRRLSETRLLEEGVTVLGILREGFDFIGVPRGETLVESGDKLVLYGREESIETLYSRRKDEKGSAEHNEAVEGTRRERALQAWEERRHRHGDDVDDPRGSEAGPDGTFLPTDDPGAGAPPADR